MNRSFLLICLVIVSFLYSCQRQSVSTRNAIKRNNLEINDFDFDYLKGKAKVNYLESSERQNAKANFRIKKDSIIWIQFSGVGGIEGGRCLITQDSIIIVDRINKEYVKMDYYEISEKYKFDFDFELFQSMILGNMPLALDSRDRVSKNSNHFVIKQKPDRFNVESYIGRETMKLEKVLVEEVITKNTMNLEYDNFQTVNDKLLPFRSSIALKYNKTHKSLFTEIKVEFSKAEISDKPLKFPFSVPDKYALRE
ncbi:DUF4292 domain-containing protein [Fulvivirgaceae bacterium BMA10]|uniref:DUF4292 domain-containing protein n=1 Tax=Splendidivirga corallicola TaxID=3051826 RepID=A0ABT8KLK4_9BACT|nr:DUF4292 domain-containing protein [Fulvivirgaceae bacterium BMA10]